MVKKNESHSSSDDNERNPVDVLADEFAHRIRQGETPSIEDYVQRYPKLESEIRAVFPAIARIEKASRHQLSRAGTSSVQTSNIVADLNLEKIGDFQIIRQIGQGGMGIVYEALQVSLHRHVALKIISPAISNSPKQLARFEREAATAARLHHTNIVPVFGSGEENGIHYFAMQLIDGIPLHEAVRQLRHNRSFDFESAASTFQSTQRSKSPNSNQPQTRLDEFRSPKTLTEKSNLTVEVDSPAAESDTSRDANGKLPSSDEQDSEKKKSQYRMRVCSCVAEIADALRYAHEQGVLHRDIKPSNLLMDKQGTVWVTDFGLAKFDDHDGLTRTGDMVGTLRYMSPEQFSGEGDARSDICSLGLTLFELLVLQPAYTETRSAPLMKLKTEQPPPSPKKVDPSIPNDLDTIVLKACAVDPNHRYQTAGEFHDDLIRFMEGRPINARPVNLLEQAWRWSKRNPMVASLASLSILLLATVAAVSVIANQTTRSALKDKQLEFDRAEKAKLAAQDALNVAKTQKRLADANFSVAIRAFEEIMENISRRGIPHGIAVEVEQEEVRSFETSLTSSDVEVLEILLAFFAEFAEQNKADLSYQSALAYKRVAEIQQSLGRLGEAEETFELAIKSFKSLGRDVLSSDENVLIQMRILNEMAYCANRRGDFEKAEASLRRGKSIYESQADKPPALQLEFARSLNIFTSMYTRVGYVINRRAINPRNSPNAKPTNPKSPLAKAATNSKSLPNKNRIRKPQLRRQKIWITINNLFAEKKLEIRKANRNAISILLSLIQSDSGNSKYQLELSRAYQDRVRINRQTRDAAKAFEQAKKILEGLVEKHPNNPAYRFELADLLCNLEKNRNSFSNPYAAARVAKELVEKWPNVSEYQALYANAAARSAIQRIGDRPANRKRLEESVDIYRELVAKYPDYYAYKINFSQYLIILASQFAIAGEKTESQSLFEEAENCLQSMESNDENDELIETLNSELRAARALAEKVLLRKALQDPATGRAANKN